MVLEPVGRLAHSRLALPFVGRERGTVLVDRVFRGIFGTSPFSSFLFSNLLCVVDFFPCFPIKDQSNPIQPAKFFFNNYDPCRRQAVDAAFPSQPTSP